MTPAEREETVRWLTEPRPWAEPMPAEDGLVVHESELRNMTRKERQQVYGELLTDALRQGDAMRLSVDDYFAMSPKEQEAALWEMAHSRKRLTDAGIEVASGVGGNPLRLVKRRPKLVAMVLRWLRWRT